MDKTNLYYFHNIKADAQLATAGNTNIDWLDVKGSGFSFDENRNKYRFWPKTAYFPITVLRRGRPWANFDVQRLKLHVVTRGDFDNQLSAFVSLLKPRFPDLTVKGIKIKYIEICTRYPDKYFNSVGESIKKAETRFFTTIHADGVDKRIKGKTWLTMGRELFIDKNTLNIKTYRFIENFNEKKRTISELVLPKIEVQIYKPKSLEEAKQEAVFIIKAFQKYIGFDTQSMSNEPDYVLIQDSSLFSHNEKLLNCLKENISVKAVKFPKEVTKDELTHKVACFITPEAKSSQEIMSYAPISRSTLQRVLNKLKPYLEKRGNNSGIYYQIDTNLIEQSNVINKGEDSCITKHRVNSNTSNKNKGKSKNPSVKSFNGQGSGIVKIQVFKNKQKPKIVRILVEDKPKNVKQTKVTIFREETELTNRLANLNRREVRTHEVTS